MHYRSKIPYKSPLVLSKETRLIITLLFFARGRGSIHVYPLCGVWKSNAGIFAHWSGLPHDAPAMPRAFPACLMQWGGSRGTYPASPVDPSFWRGSTLARYNRKVLLMYKRIIDKQPFILKVLIMEMCVTRNLLPLINTWILLGHNATASERSG